MIELQAMNDICYFPGRKEPAPIMKTGSVKTNHKGVVRKTGNKCGSFIATVLQRNWNLSRRIFKRSKRNAGFHFMQFWTKIHAIHADVEKSADETSVNRNFKYVKYLRQYYSN